MGTLHTEYFKIRTSEINHLKLLHPHALIQLMQEASMQHTIRMKVSVWDLERLHSSWVLLKMQVTIHHYPTLNEDVRVETYPSGLDGYFTYRDYFMYDQNDKLYATITSMWTLMNTASRKIMKIPDSFGSLVYGETNALARPEFRLKSIDIIKRTSEIQVNYYHLDWNGHVNNVQLVRLILESLDSNITSKMKMKSMSVHFKLEAMIGQTIVFNNETVNDQNIRHAVKDKITGKDLLLAETEWEALV
jgi:medium-chain acyl-[acyl-carrier-protein] hydrolase